METNRRTFMKTLAANVAATRLVRGSGPRYPIAFSTLGCPTWSWKTILEQADRLGYAAIELRGVAGEMDLPKVPELSGSRIGEARKDLDGAGIVVSDLGASAHMHEKDPAARAKQLDDGRRFIDLAHALGVKYVRIFGDKVQEGDSREDTIQRVVAGARELADYAK